MKKSILIFCAALTTFSLMALGYVNSIHSSSDRKCNSEREKLVSVDGFKSTVDNLYASELFYNVDSRFLTTITKENLHNAKSIIDILPEKATKSVMSFRNVKVSVLKDDDPKSEMSERGNDTALNEAQLKLLNSTEYSNNIVIYADYTSMNENTGLIENNYLSYYIMMNL